MTKIEWTDETWNPVTGCTRISPGCQNCYAERMARRLAGRCGYPENDPFWVMPRPDRLDQPPRWKKPHRVFVCSMGDLFHNYVTNAYISRVFDVMRRTPQHTYQVLTKRPDNMQEWQTWSGFRLPNVWLGVSAEDQKYADERIPTLLQIPAATRFVSVEPMLGPVDLFEYLYCPACGHANRPGRFPCLCGNLLEWVIIGCESGPGRRPMRLEWAIDLVRQCKDFLTEVPVFVKQIEVNGRVSHDPAEWPEELRVREFPRA